MSVGILPVAAPPPPVGSVASAGNSKTWVPSPSNRALPSSHQIEYRLVIVTDPPAVGAFSIYSAAALETVTASPSVTVILLITIPATPGLAVWAVPPTRVTVATPFAATQIPVTVLDAPASIVVLIPIPRPEVTTNSALGPSTGGPSICRVVV